MSCAAVAKVLLLDDDTVRSWHRLYEEDGIEGLADFGYGGSACRLSDEQQDKLKAWMGRPLCQRPLRYGYRSIASRWAEAPNSHPHPDPP